MKKMPSYNILVYASLYTAIVLTSPFASTVLTNAYIIASPNPDHSLPNPTSSFASKVIYESPSIENIYKEFLVTSKPIVLRKYGHATKKTKKTKKESKIYFIPIPPMPYRFIPGVGYDYQPIKINPIMKDTPSATVSGKQTSTKNGNNTFKQSIKLNQKTSEVNFNGQTNQTQMNTIRNSTATESPKDSKIIRMDLKKHHFDGRPFKLLVAHAQGKHSLSPHNLKSKFYLNKKIIY